METFQLAATLTTVIAVILMILGLACSVIPSLPGPLILWFGMVTWAWAGDFQQVGWGILSVLLVVAIAAMAVDFVITVYMSRRVGASWKSIGGGIVGGLVGGLLLSGFPPILGSIVGAILGVVAGMWLIEYWDKQDRPAATRAVRGYLASVVVSATIELGIALSMAAIFAWSVLA
ncbi:MAG: DUF456 domain-containing protein [Litorilinea sp.]